MRFEFLTLDYDDCPPDQKPARFGFECPRKGHLCSGMLLRNGPHVAENNPDIPRKTWEFNGNREAPTFRPSINCGACGAHGYVTDGVWRDA